MSYKNRYNWNIPLCLPQCKCKTCREKKDEKKIQTEKSKGQNKKSRKEFFRNFQNQKRLEDIYSIDKRLSLSSLEALDNLIQK